MGTTLTGTTPQDTYDSLIKVTDNGPLSGALKALSDGLGNDSTLSLSTTAASIAGTLAVTGASTFSSTITMALGGNPRLTLQDTDAGAGNVGILFQESTSPKWTLASNGGSFQFFNEATSSNAVWVSSTNNVGIGTTSPVAILDARTTVGSVFLNLQGTNETNSGESATIRLWGTQFNTANRHSEIANVTSGSTASNNLVFRTNGVEGMRIDSSGNVGIGTSSPANTLDVAGTGRIKSSVADYLLTIENIQDDSQGLLVRASDNDSLPILKLQSSVGATSETWIDRFVVNKDGNVGIGTDAPLQKLGIDGSIVLQSSTVATQSLIFRSPNSNWGPQNSRIDFTPADGTNASVDLSFNLWNGSAGNTIERLRITSAGNVGIGTSAPQAKLDVTKTGKATIVVMDTTAFAAGVGGSIDLGGNYRTTGDFQSFTRIAAEKSNATDGNFGYDLGFYVTTNGGSTIGTKVATMTSDAYVRLAASTGGIQFNGDTAAANALDDYEEGTFTMTATPATSGTITLNPSNNTARYTKIGRQVTIQAFVTVSAVSSPVGTSVILGGLPFTIANTNAAAGSGSVAWADASASYVRSVLPSIFFANTTLLYASIDASTVASPDELFINMTYTV